MADGANALIYLAQGDYVNAGLSAASMVPLAGIGATGAKLGMKANNAFDLVGAAKTSKNITYLTKAGNYLRWSTVKSRYWKLMNGGKVPTGTAQVRMRETGEIKTVKGSKELHHINGRTGADPHRFSNLKDVWPWEHQAIDPSRHTGYDFIHWVK